MLRLENMCFMRARFLVRLHSLLRARGSYINQPKLLDLSTLTAMNCLSRRLILKPPLHSNLTLNFPSINVPFYSKPISIHQKRKLSANTAITSLIQYPLSGTFLCVFLQSKYDAENNSYCVMM